LKRCESKEGVDDAQAAGQGSNQIEGQTHNTIKDQIEAEKALNQITISLETFLGIK
jgi:hypothetical protein